MGGLCAGTQAVEGPLMARMVLTKEYEFSAAHALPMVAETHKCRRVHGHNWIVKISVRGAVQDDGFVCDYGDIDHHAKPIIADLDHRNLNDIMPNPTSENVCIYIWKKLSRLPGLCEVSVCESSRTTCTYRGEV